MELKNKNVLVVGLGQKGVGAVKLLHQKGAKVRAYDIKSRGELGKAFADLANIPFEHELGRLSEKSTAELDLVVVAAPLDVSHPIFEPMKASQVPVIAEIELAFMFKPAHTKVIALTGAFGKTTVATLIQQVLKKAGRTNFLAADTGLPLTEAVMTVQENDFWVVEMKSNQLRGIKNFQIDYWVAMSQPGEELIPYLANARSSKTTNVVNWDDENLRQYSRSMTGSVLAFVNADITKSYPEWVPTYQGCYAVKRRQIRFVRNGAATDISLESFRMPGSHNRQNVMAAALVAHLAEVPLGLFQELFAEFKGVPHRLEYVRKKDGVTFYNDSESASVNRVARAIGSFDQQLIVVMGGKESEEDFEPLVPWIKKRVKNLILVGQAKEKINRVLGDYSETFLVGTFEEAVLISYQKSRNGDVVLLSPGCPPSDMFKSIEERGEYFRKLAYQL